MLLAAVMAMILAAAAPAFAQANAVGGSIQYADCDQIQAAATGQYNTDNQQDAAALAQELGVDENQVLACLGSIAAGRDVNINAASASASATSTATAKMKAAKATSTATAGGGGGGGGSASAGGGGSAAAASAAAGGALPPTGGVPLLALGAGALLVAGGLLARRIVR
jgi:hypothetical protein